VIYAFDGTDGYEPWGTVVKDKNGALYGTTYAGGAPDTGVAFMLSPSGGKWTETVLHVFNWQTGDGYNPEAGLTWGPSGVLYGTTSSGGTLPETSSNSGNHASGTVFELTQSGGIWTETILHTFGGEGDGGGPQGAVIPDKNGDLYGTAFGGGVDGFGAVWKVNR
jgi:uncharacterized repeat protein (TIGR03803 family)